MIDDNATCCGQFDWSHHLASENHMKKFLLGSIAIAAISAMAVTLSWDMILQQVIKSSLLTITTRFQTNLLSDGALHVVLRDRVATG